MEDGEDKNETLFDLYMSHKGHRERVKQGEINLKFNFLVYMQSPTCSKKGNAICETWWWHSHAVEMLLFTKTGKTEACG